MDSAGEVLEALRRYAASAPTSAGLDVDTGDAAGELIALGKAVAVLDAALGAAMVRYDRLGAGSPAAILVQHAGLTRTHAANLRKLGRKLAVDLPATRERLTSGQIGTAQARSIIDLDEELAAADTPVPQAARRQVETALADYATDATTTEVMRAARDARYRLTPDTVEREMRDRYDARGITLSETFAGLTHITGLADPVTAATLNNHLNHHAGRRDRHDTRTTAARRLDALADAVTLADRITTTPDNDTPTDPPPANPTPAAGRALPDDGALQESCNDPDPARSAESGGSGGSASRPVRMRPGLALTGEDPRTGNDDPLNGAPPGGGTAARGRLVWRKTSPAHMLIIATHDLLTGTPGATPARLGDGTMIPADTARRYTCEAALTRAILATETEPLELGRSTRLFTTAQVRALIARDHGCRWPGCDVPPAACTPHHVTWWTNGGTTDVTNGALLCPVHHRMVHEDRWQLAWADDDPDTLIIEAPAHWPLRPPTLTSPPPYTRQPQLPEAA